MSWLERTDSYFRNLNLRELWVDEAYLNVSNGMHLPYYLYTLSPDCVECPYRKFNYIEANKDTVMKMKTSRSLEMKLYYKDHGQYVLQNQSLDRFYAHFEPKMGQFGVYDMIIDERAVNRFEVAKEPVPIYWSMLVVALIIFAFYWLCKGINFFILSRFRKTHNDALLADPIKKRLKSLDIFRGISIVCMIFVWYGGGHYWWMQHAIWNGLLVSDIVFPWFLFIMGVCIPISIKSQFTKGIPTIKIVKKVFTRSCLLFAIGLCVFTQGTIFKEVRIMNVLQRFAIAYFVVSLVHIAFIKYPEVRQPQLLDDIKIIWKDWVVMFAILAIHLGTVFGIKLNGCDRGYVGPGGIHEYMKNQMCTGGLVQYIDEKILTENHMFQWSDVRRVYDATLRFDPEGIYASLTAIFHAFLGLQCGMTLMVFSGHKQRIVRWILWGCALAIVTAILTFCRLENAPIPINKNLWSLTFVTLTSATSFWLLALIYFLSDVKNWCDDFWTVFQYPGMNAILLYVGNAILDNHWPFHFFVANMNTHFIYLLKHSYTAIIWILAAHIMYHKKFFFNL